ncbi:MAG: hypothetical protein PVSMB1_05700 [Gemmatimonadaceae bacterium]
MARERATRKGGAPVSVGLWFLMVCASCSGEARTAVVSRSGASVKTSTTSPGRASSSHDEKNAVCALMPLADVAKILAPALAMQRPGPGAPSEKADYSMCHYDFPGKPKVLSGIELTDFQTVDRARDAFRAQHDMNAQRTDVIHSLADLAGYGDVAFVTDEPGIYSAGVSVRTGSFILRTIVGVDDQPFSFRLPLAEALAKEVLRRRQ